MGLIINGTDNTVKVSDYNTVSSSISTEKTYTDSGGAANGTYSGEFSITVDGNGLKQKYDLEFQISKKDSMYGSETILSTNSHTEKTIEEENSYPNLSGSVSGGVLKITLTNISVDQDSNLTTFTFTWINSDENYYYVYYKTTVKTYWTLEGVESVTILKDINTNEIKASTLKVDEITVNKKLTTNTLPEFLFEYQEPTDFLNTSSIPCPIPNTSNWTYGLFCVMLHLSSISCESYSFIQYQNSFIIYCGNIYLYPSFDKITIGLLTAKDSLSTSSKGHDIVGKITLEYYDNTLILKAYDMEGTELSIKGTGDVQTIPLNVYTLI